MNGRPLDTLFSVLETEYGPLDASETTLVADAKTELAELRSERDTAIRERDEAVEVLRGYAEAATFEEHDELIFRATLFLSLLSAPASKPTPVRCGCENEAGDLCESEAGHFG